MSLNNPAMNKLRSALMPCCGLGANPSTVNAALDDVEQSIVRRSHWVMELLNVNSELTAWARSKDNQDAQLLGVLVPKFLKIARAIRQQLELEISEDDQTQALRHNLPDTAPTASTKKVLQESGLAADQIEINFSHLKSLLWVEKVTINYEFGLAAGFLPIARKEMVKRQSPWDFDATFKLIGRRINQAVNARQFIKAQRLEDMRLALICVQSYEADMANKGEN